LPPAAARARSRGSGVQTLRALGLFARRKPLGALGAVIVGALLVMALFAEQIAPYGYDDTIRGARMRPPSTAHWLGTDNLSRDMWSRIVYGARVSVTVGFATVALAVVLATTIGVSSGVLRRRVRPGGPARGRRVALVSVSRHRAVGHGGPRSRAPQRRALTRHHHRGRELARDPRGHDRDRAGDVRRSGAGAGLRAHTDLGAATSCPT
jgi:hypothetical protein